MPRLPIPSLSLAIAASAIVASADAPSASAADAWYSINPSTNECYIPDKGPAEILADAQRVQQIMRYRTQDSTDPSTGAVVETTIEMASPLLGTNDFVPLGTFYRGAARCEAESSKEKAALAAQQAATQAEQDAATAAAVAKYGAQPSPDQRRAAVTGDPAPSNDTVALSADQRGAVGDHVRECWTNDAGALNFDKMRVMLTVTTDANGLARKVEVAGADVGRMSDPGFRAFVERVKRTILDPHCANLPLPNSVLGRVNVLTFRFSP